MLYVKDLSFTFMAAGTVLATYTEIDMYIKLSTFMNDTVRTLKTSKR